MTITLSDPMAAALCFFAGIVVAAAATALLVAWSVVMKNRR